MTARGWMTVIVGTLLLGVAPTAEGQQEGARRGWLGIVFVADGEGTDRTVRIESVYPGSPAAAAGVQAGDEIVQWNGNSNVPGVLESLRLQPGDTVRLRIRRGNATRRDLAVVAGPRPARVTIVAPGRTPEAFGMSPDQWQSWQEQMREAGEQMARAFEREGQFRGFRPDSLARVWGERFKFDSLAVHADSLHKGIQLMLRDSLGPHLRSLNDQLRLLVPEGTSRAVITLGHRAVAGAEFEEMNEGLSSYFGTDEGVLVLRVSPGTPAARAGLQAGDVILEADDREVDSVDDLRSAVSRAQRDRARTVALEVLRRGQRRALDLRWE